MKALLFILVTIVLTSCGRKGDEIKEGSASIRVIDLLSEPESTISNLSDIATDVNYIPLETGKNSMIKFINKVIIRGDYIYINNAANEILCFDMNGKFINKLAAGGRGPGEYTGIMGFDVSSDNKMLILLSSNKIFEYSNTGSEFVFLKTIDLSRPAPLYCSFVPGTTNIMLSSPSWYGNESTLSLLVDINGDTLNLRENYYKYELVEKRHAFSTWDAIQYVMDDRVCFNEKLSDTVFCVSSESNNFMPWLILDSRGTLINTKIMSDVEYAKSHSSEYSQVAYIYEVPRYLFYYYRYKDMNHKIISLFPKKSSDKIKKKRKIINLPIHKCNKLCYNRNEVC